MLLEDTFTLYTSRFSLRAVQTIGINIDLFDPRGQVQAKERRGRDRTNRDFLISERNLLGAPRVGQADGKREKNVLYLPIVTQFTLRLKRTGRIPDCPAGETQRFRFEPQRYEAVIRAPEIEPVGSVRLTAYRYDRVFQRKGWKAHQQACDLACREQHLGQTRNIERAGNTAVENLIAREIGSQPLSVTSMNRGYPKQGEQLKAKTVRGGKGNGLRRRTPLNRVPVRDLGQPAETGDGLLSGMKRCQQLLGRWEGARRRRQQRGRLASRTAAAPNDEAAKNQAPE